MSLIRNERLKLTAAALNTAATSSFTVGVLAPIAAVFYNEAARSGDFVRIKVETLILGTVIWLLAAVALHISARWVLKGLKE